MAKNDHQKPLLDQRYSPPKMSIVFSFFSIERPNLLNLLKYARKCLILFCFQILIRVVLSIMLDFCPSIRIVVIEVLDKIFFMFGVSFWGQSVFASYVIMPRSEYFSQVAEYQIGHFSPKLRVLDSRSSSLEYKICSCK